MQTLIDAGADPNEEEEIIGRTPLHVAGEKNRLEVLRVLLRAGIDALGKKTAETCHSRRRIVIHNSGEKPFMYACESGHVASVDVFLSYIKDLEAVQRALCLAAEKGQSQVVARILKHPGILVDGHTNGDFALIRACRFKNVKVMQVLLNAGANPQRRSSTDGTSNALHTFCFSKRRSFETKENPTIG